MLQVDPLVYLFGAFLLLTLPLGWLIAALCAAAIHELCHILMLHFCGGNIISMRIGVGGAMIESELPSRPAELVCTLAGPAGSILLLSVHPFFPRLAICAVVQGLFNLLPIYPLDGGHILRCCLEWICPENAIKIQSHIELLLMVGMVIFAVVGAYVLSFGVMPLILTLVLFLKTILRKRPCKQGRNRVQ